MSELLPTRTAKKLQDGLVDYLTTTFALSDAPAQEALKEFLTDTDSGLFRGPYVRARLPFRPADEGWRDHLDWYKGFTPYGHQAKTFERLSSLHQDPKPTLVVTGTGSGKTEAFLYPIIDHVLRAKAKGDHGLKALILYPMNALANDQAERIAELIISNEELNGITAALYTGEQSGGGLKNPGLITDRYEIRKYPPDILLTNYKMLDQILLRPNDKEIIKAASSLQYLVLDEFHTYDGAQGTDVAMLLRRLGLAIKEHLPETQNETQAAPLGRITPVATSATLGDEGDTHGMRNFAETVFGIPFHEDSVVTETRLSIAEWVAQNLNTVNAEELLPKPIKVTVNTIDLLSEKSKKLETASSAELVQETFKELFDTTHLENNFKWEQLSNEELGAVAASHPFVQQIADHAQKAVSLSDLSDRILPKDLRATETVAERNEKHNSFLNIIFAALSHVRAKAGRSALSIDVNLWVRELSRIDREAASSVNFKWSDDGVYAQDLQTDSTIGKSGSVWQPAIYCRHCGRSGWAVQLAPMGDALDPDQSNVRRNHAAKERSSKIRALIYAPQEETAYDAGEEMSGLAWFESSGQHALRSKKPSSEHYENYSWLPVLTLTGEDIDDRSRDDECPACQQKDSIRFLGSAIATILSVLVTSLFGDASLADTEKKALIFTDSVQDAAHRAAFVQSRAHTFSLRNAITKVLDGNEMSLEEVTNELINAAGDDPIARYRLLAPDLVNREGFKDFWQKPKTRSVPNAVMRRVRSRLLFDASLEFGLQSHLGRTLELTETATAKVDVQDKLLLNVAKAAVDTLDVNDDKTMQRWSRGVLEKMRERGAISHHWLKRYLENDGRRYYIWGGRRSREGMPAFPSGRQAPAFPRVRKKTQSTNTSIKSEFDTLTSRSWYAQWAKKNLDVNAAEGALFTRELLLQLQKEGVIESTSITGGTAVVYGIAPSNIVVTAIEHADGSTNAISLECDICASPASYPKDVAETFMEGPCLSSRCPGALRKKLSDDDNYYRKLYSTGSMRRVVAKEHTGLLESKLRLQTENAFKSSDSEADSPNVLVATPTLEMGIDIGDLSTVILAGLPRSTASYLQRIGRAGRLTGNALALATVSSGRNQIQKIHEPLGVINGTVTPPATYLNAQEILQRQFFAYLLDCRAITSNDERSLSAKDVLRNSEKGTLLRDVLNEIENNAAQHLNRFLTSFDIISTESKERLIAWATPSEGAQHGLAIAVHTAVERWNSQVSDLTYRRKEIENSLPELENAVERGFNEEQAEKDLRTAKATLKLVRAQLQQLREEYWVGALERFGLLPNYTLLDDSVELAAAVSWADPDTGEWQNDPRTYQRGASLAIRELAPGSYFYAQGLEIPIDAVDLGVGGDALFEWSVCSECGYMEESSERTPALCPRCSAGGLNSRSQTLEIVELKTVTAVTRRDEAGISDRRDERQRTHFQVVLAADLNPTGIIKRWFDKVSGFAATYANDLTLRWLNLGASLSGGTLAIAGQEINAPLFRVCDTCGQRDEKAGSNSAKDHRFWCPRRNLVTEHSKTIALSRTLTTQGVFFRLPPAIALGDPMVIPSLTAAIMRSLREMIGGDPDHIGVSQVREPLFQQNGETTEAILLHDAVPGGTGYLADLAEPDTVHELLYKAWEIVHECECRTTAALSCSKCLLPHAEKRGQNASRAIAEQTLAKLLRIEDGEVQGFQVTDDDPGVKITESAIEQVFRKRFIERAVALGVKPKTVPSDSGTKVHLTFPNGRTWVLSPQVNIGATKPDFLLEAHGGGIKKMAIYTDGKKYHASKQYNRLSDDAKKRHGLREQGYHVISVTWDDLQDNKEFKHDWFDEAFAEQAAPMFKIPHSRLDRFMSDPLTMIMLWLQNPDAETDHMKKAAQMLPILLINNSTPVDIINTSQLAIELLDNQPQEAAPDAQIRANRFDYLSVISDLSDSNKLGLTLVLDDREDALQSAGFDKSWRLWLHLSNIAGWNSHKSLVDVSTYRLSAQRQSEERTYSQFDGTALGMSGDWQTLLEAATEEEKELLKILYEGKVMLIPELGGETKDGIPLAIAWHKQQVSLDLDLEPEEIEELKTVGWKIIEADKENLATRVNRVLQNLTTVNLEESGD